MHAIFCNSPQLPKLPKLSHQLLRDAGHKFKLGLKNLDKYAWKGSPKFSRSLLTVNGKIHQLNLSNDLPMATCIVPLQDALKTLSGLVYSDPF